MAGTLLPGVNSIAVKVSEGVAGLFHSSFLTFDLEMVHTTWCIAVAHWPDLIVWPYLTAMKLE